MKTTAKRFKYIREWRKNNPDRVKKYQKKYDQKNKEKKKEYAKKYRKEYWKDYYQKNKDKFHKLHKIYYQKNKEKIEKYIQKWRLDNKDKVHKSQKKWRENNPEKTKAIHKLNYAIDSGKITRPIRCSGCGEKLFPQGHHEDYSKALEVDWLCVKCHNKIPKGERKWKRI